MECVVIGFEPFLLNSNSNIVVLKKDCIKHLVAVLTFGLKLSDSSEQAVPVLQKFRVEVQEKLGALW